MIRRHLTSVAVIAVAMVLTGCNVLELPEYGEPLAPTEELANGAVPTSGAKIAPPAAKKPEPVVKQSLLLVTKGEHPEQQRQKELLSKGFEALPADSVGYYMDIQEARLRQEFANTDILIKRDSNSITLVVPGAAMFASSSSQLNPGVLNSLDGIAKVLAEYDKTLVAVEGYTDNTGPSDYNQHLSEQRALSVGAYLAEKGVGAKRLIVVGYGERQPMASNDVEVGRAINRRVELTLYPLTLASSQ